MAADLRSPRPLAEAELVVDDSTPVALSDLFAPAVLGRAKSALITANEYPVFYRLSGGTWDDEKDFGHTIPAGGEIGLQTRGLLTSFLALAVDDDATLFVTLFT